MKLDDVVCICFHVTLRKLLNFAAKERPRVDSQMTGCGGAGTGCGSCIPILRRIAAAGRAGEELDPSVLDDAGVQRDERRRQRVRPADGSRAADARPDRT